MAEPVSTLTAPPFALRDCALITQTTGRRAHNLKEFREGVQQVPAGSLYHHFWGRLLRPQFDEPEYNNDFASWAWRGLHDKPLAERLSMVISSDFDSLEGVRQELLEIIDQRLGESELILWSAADQMFYFLQAQIAIFDTGQRLTEPAELMLALPTLATGSIFYHFIDARRRTADRRDDFSLWLAGFGGSYQPLVERLESLDPYFSSLKEIRYLLTSLFQQFFEEQA